MATLIAHPAVLGNLGKLNNNMYVCSTDVTQANIAQLTQSVLENQGIKVGDILMVNFKDGTDMYKVGASFALKLYSHAT